MMERLLRFIFSKKLLNALLLLVQVALWGAVFFWFREYSPYFKALYIMVDIFLILWEINREESVDFKIVWVLLIALLPIAGALMYIMIHMDPISRRITAAHSEEVLRSRPYYRQDAEVRRHLKEREDTDEGIFRYLDRAGSYPVWEHTEADYYPSGEEFFEALKDALEQAEKFIFMEFFIIGTGHMWDTIHTILKRKVRQGVEVRLLYDSMGCLGILPSDYYKTLQSEGIDCRVFSPIKPFLSTYQNNRDHRKICVVDGHTAFTGGINLADEYINKKERFGHWKDTAIAIRGEAVRNFTVMFLQMWNTGAKESEHYTPYLINEAFTPASDGFVAPFGDAPLDREQVGKEVYIHLLNTAKRYVYIMTPYLVPDADLLEAMKFAAKRGVSVKILMPHIPDKWYAFSIAHSYYPELLRAGVQIYEYTPGFIHAKVTVSDDSRAVVGSINYDFRSLYLHYECAVYLEKNSVIPEILADVQNTLASCERFNLTKYKKLPFFHRLFGWVFRVLSPLL